MSLLQLKQEKQIERKKLAEQTSELIVKASKEKRSLTPAENAEWEARHADIDRLGDEITKLEKQIDLDAHLGAPATDTRMSGFEDTTTERPAGGPVANGGKVEKPDQFKTLRKLALYGGDFACLTPLEKQMFVYPMGDAGGQIRGQIEESGGNYETRSMFNPTWADTRAMGGSSGAGDAMIPQGFVYTLNVALKWYGGIIDPNVCTYLDTTMGNLMPYPNVDDTGNTGEITAENSTVTGGSGTGDTDPTFSVVNLSANMYDSGVVLVPIQLIQDAAFNTEQYLVGDTNLDNPRGQKGLLAIRIGRKLNADCTTGDGSNKPKGIVSAAALGLSGASPTTISYNELVELEHSVDPAYRGSDAYGVPLAKFMFNDSTLKALKKLADSNNRPLWIAGGVSEGVQGRRPDMFNGYSYVINQDMASLGSSAKSILFGDFKKYIIRRVRGLEVFTFRERYMNNLQIGFLGYQRYDGQLLTAGSPVKYFQNSAT
ncbi:MAG: phage major capsid protein [Patescibacteria group bacterium]|nr:phage major capsid protein [Patescibacteria group bacterium]